jgi:amino acid transporter
MLVNLRGIRESSNAFVYPTYAFILGIFVLLGAGIYQALISGAPVIPPESLVKKQLDFSMFFLLLRAFANGCSSMTGIEAIADSVPLFNKPESKNAVTTTYWMVGILGLMFSGITFLMMHYHILPINEVTSLSQIAEIIFGRGWMYYYIQISTMLILYLAANTAYNGLPVLMSIIARDGYMPRYLSNRGERLTYSNGIILLTLAAAFLIVVYGGETEHLISLYAIGVFISFTIAQTGMIVHWKNEKSSGWQLKAIINGIGALTTGLIVLIIAVSKFTHGAWIIILFIPTAVYTFKKIKAHYTDVAEQLHLPIDQEQKFVTGRNIVVVPVSSLSRVVYDTVRYAKTISDHVILLHVAESEESAQKVREKFEDWQPHVDLITLQNPYRMLVKPVCDFVDEVLANKNPEDFVTVIVPEFEPNKWWQRFLHGQSGWILRTYLILMKDVVVSTIPFHLKK